MLSGWDWKSQGLDKTLELTTGAAAGAVGGDPELMVVLVLILILVLVVVVLVVLLALVLTLTLQQPVQVAPTSAHVRDKNTNEAMRRQVLRKLQSWGGNSQDLQTKVGEKVT